MRELHFHCTSITLRFRYTSTSLFLHFNYTYFFSFSLYLWAFTQMFPTGSFVRRHLKDDFKPVLSDRHQLMYRFMDWYAQKHNLKISHKMNSGKEKRDFSFLSDGFCEATQFLAPGAISPTNSLRGSPKGLIVQFDGCVSEIYMSSHTV